MCALIFARPLACRLGWVEHTVSREKESKRGASRGKVSPVARGKALVSTPAATADMEKRKCVRHGEEKGDGDGVRVNVVGVRSNLSEI